MLQQALQTAQQVVVVLGSAFQARSPKNPFTWQERATLIRSSLPAADAARVHCVPVRDYYDEPRWVQAVMAAVHTQVPPSARVALVGHFKDDSSNYLARFPGWELLSLPRQGDFDGTPTRELYWNLADLPTTALVGTAHPTAARPRGRVVAPIGKPAPITPPCAPSGACSAATTLPGPAPPIPRCL